MLAAAKVIGGGLATIALAGAGVGIGNVFGSLVLAVSRNPNEKDELFRLAILGFALTEAIALFSLMMAFLILFLRRLVPETPPLDLRVQRLPQIADATDATMRTADLGNPGRQKPCAS
jgi:F0F1-type ATP synthase membrane subunit c/vacuolar-type H+-ATPase subunit K